MTRTVGGIDLGAPGQENGCMRDRADTQTVFLLSYAVLPVWTTPPFESTTPSAQEASTRPSWNCSW
jgi:hypothetical protein